MRQALGDRPVATFTLRAEDQTWSQEFHQGELNDIFAPLLARPGCLAVSRRYR
ncbi:Chaperone protein hscC (Hsc62) [Cronobacter malonaticus 507]|nr:Chaperone protein hscC (Hsc62) [Cronobacter malonaticus 507]